MILSSDKNNENERLIRFALKISRFAGNILLNNQGRAKIKVKKGKNDYATSADLMSEKYLIGQILKNYPEHGIYSEETGVINENAEYKWIIDPLDGTKEYYRGLPNWNCSIMLTKNGKDLLSVINKPQNKNIYHSILGSKVFKNKKIVKVSKTKKLSDSFVYCYIPSFQRDKEKYEISFKRLSKLGKHVFRLRATPEENIALCWLAQGSFEAYINLSNTPKDYDIRPGAFIAKQSGAYVDRKIFPIIACNNKNIYNQIIDIIL